MKLNPETAKYIQLIMAGFCLIFSASLWIELNRDYPLMTDSDVAGKPVEAMNPEENDTTPRLPPIEEFASIIERPLFADNRRPPIPDDGNDEELLANLPAEDMSNPGELSLSGIIITDNKQIALIQNNSEKKIFRLGPGELIAGWSVEEIREKEILLSRGDESKTLKLQVKKSPQAGTNQSRRPQRQARQPQINPQNRPPETQQGESREQRSQNDREVTGAQENPPPTVAD